MRKVPIAVIRAIFDASLSVLHFRGDDFLTMRHRPKRGNRFPYKVVDPIVRLQSRSIGVVIQGPLLLDDDFTFETVRYYRAVCPEMTVILSTWKDEHNDKIARFEALGVHVVLSEKPSNGGRCNVNFQMRSAWAGIQKAKEVGNSYVAKTRSDQRIYGIHLLATFPTLLRGAKCEVQGQKERLIVTSMGTLRYAPLHVSDLFMFGTIEDLDIYWDASDEDCETERRKRIDEINACGRTFDECTRLSPERFLFTRYLERVAAEKPSHSLICWWQILARRCIVIDWDYLDIYWPKYTPHDDRPDMAVSFGRMASVQVTWADWLLLTMLGDFQVPEEQLKLAAGSPNRCPPLHAFEQLI